MGIELPPELADVAARAGVQWPQADEEAMRSSAQAWRRAGSKLTSVATDADGTANHALSAVTGETGTAAHQHWQTFVAPDTGHLTATAQGCTAAADRLDHAADQVGAAKVQIVSHLVDLAKHTDAADAAAAAGHPAALASVPTLVQGTAGSVAQVNHNLTSSIRLDPSHPATSVTGHVGPLGQDGLLGSHGPVGAVAQQGPLGQDGLLGSHGPVGAVAQQGPSGHGDLLGQQGTVGSVVQQTPLGGHGPGGPGGPLGPVTQGVAVQGGPGPDHGPGGFTGDPTQTGPIPGLVHGGAPAHPIGSVLSGHEPPGVPTPPLGVTVAQSAAPSMAAPPQAPPLDTGLPPVAAPIAHQPIPAPSAPTPPLGTPAPDFGSAPPAPPAAGAPPAANIGRTAEVVRAEIGRAEIGRSTPDVVVANTPPARSAAVPPQAGQQNAAVTGVVRPKPAPRSDVVALFMVYVFPIGQLPTPSSRPHRQLPAPPSDTDFAPGLRFEPHDHPESHLIHTRTGGIGGQSEDGVNAPDDLAVGHDPTGGAPETEWARRFVVRPADDEHAAEYAWPPGELFPEGGRDAGEPVVLEPGTLVDRFGTQEGRVFAADGTVFAQRALPPDFLVTGYHRYRVLRDLPMWRATSAPWFGQPGGGARYRAVYPAAELVAMGYLSEITRDDDGH